MRLTASVVLAVIAAVCAGGLAVAVYQRFRAISDETYSDLVVPFLVTIIGLAIGSLGHALAGGWPAEIGPISNWVTTYILFVPWTIFSLRYAGRGYLLTRWRVIGLSVLALALIADSIRFSITGEPSPLGAVFGFLVFLVPAVVFVVAGFVLIAVYRDESIPVTSGMLVVFPVLLFFFTGQTGAWVDPSSASLLTAGTMVVAAGSFGFAVLQHDVISRRPGTSTVGEQVVLEELTEPILITSHTGIIGRSNKRAKELFGYDIAGEQVSTILGETIDRSLEKETIEVQTEYGWKQFEPRISDLTDTRNRVLGYAITLVDVTERELRQQRLTVLNRVLRHNIRNSLDVINTHAELVPKGERLSDHSDSILHQTSEIEQLSREARRLEQLLRQSATADSMTGFDLEASIETVVDDVLQSKVTANVTIDIPSITLVTHRDLFEYAVHHVIENAIQHNDNECPVVDIRGESTATGIRIIIDDDGPGIPDRPREIIEQGSENQQMHTTGIGLWATKWAIEQLGGNISFDQSELGGGSVRIELPENGAGLLRT